MKTLLLALALLSGAVPVLAQDPPAPVVVEAPPPTFSNFVPVFTFVTVTNSPVPGTLQQPVYTVNPVYCLDPTSALQLATFLSAEYGPVTIFYTGPMGWTSDFGAQVSSTVPWLMFSDGTPINAGLLANTWTHGYPISFIKSSVEQQIGMYQALTASGYNWSLQIQNLPSPSGN